MKRVRRPNKDPRSLPLGPLCVKDASIPVVPAPPIQPLNLSVCYFKLKSIKVTNK